jgi:hypothetical protein
MPSRPRLSAERLEDRVVPVRFQFDFSLDTNNFFDTQAKKDLLQRAGDMLTGRLTDPLAAMGTPAGGSWEARFDHPGTGAATTRTNLAVPADTMLVFAGGRNLSAPVIGQAKTGRGWSNSAAKAMVERGQPGSADTPATEVAPWGGSIVFDTVGTTWHFGATTDGLDNSESDFLSVAAHELGHVLGISSGTAFTRWVVGGKFTGPKAKALYGGDVPADGGHFADGTMHKGQEVMMDPSIASGTRKLPTDLDFAGFDDVGWTLDPEDDTLATGRAFTGGGIQLSNDAILSAKDVDIRRVQAARGQTIVYRITSSALDTYLKVFDDAGNVLATADDDNGTNDPDGTFTVPYSGSFFVGVSTYANRGYNPAAANSGPGGPTGSYTLRVQIGGTAGYETGNTLSDARAVDLGGQYVRDEALLVDAVGGDQDLYKFTAAAGAVLTAETAKPPGKGNAANTYLRLFDAAGRELAARDDGGPGQYARLQYRLAAAGTYYLGVSDGADRTYDPDPDLVIDGDAADGRDYRLTLSLGSATGGGDNQIGSAFPHLIARTAGGDWWVGENTGQVVGAHYFGNWVEAAGWQDVTVADVNGDGNDDVIGRTAGGDWWAGVNAGGRFANQYLGRWVESAGWRDIQVKDVNADGKVDVLARTAGGQWWLGRNTGSALDFVPYGVWVEAAGWRDVRAGDFDGDGDLDVLGRTAGGDWWLGRNAGTGLTNVPYGRWVESVGWRDVRTGDFDGDGRLDVLGRTAGGQWWLGRNTGGGLANQVFGYWVDLGWRDVRVANFAGDDRPDVIGRAANGQWWVGVNTGTGLSNALFATWAAIDWQDVMAANFTGGGYADLVGRTGGSWWVGASNGAAFTTSLFAQWSPTAGWRDGRAGDVYNGTGDDGGLAAGHDHGPTAGTTTRTSVAYFEPADEPTPPGGVRPPRVGPPRNRF